MNNTPTTGWYEKYASQYFWVGRKALHEDMDIWATEKHKTYTRFW
jgi:hypothetical protein